MFLWSHLCSILGHMLHFICVRAGAVEQVELVGPWTCHILRASSDPDESAFVETSRDDMCVSWILLPNSAMWVLIS